MFFDVPKLLFQLRIGNQILATNALGFGKFPNRHSNVGIEVRLGFSRWHNSLFQIWFSFASDMAKSLKARIDELINAIGSADKPSLPQIRSRLFKFAALAEDLEQGKAVRKAEAKVAALQAALEKSELKNSDLGTELKAALDEIKTFRIEQEKRESADAELPEELFETLRGLPTEHAGGGATLKGISKRGMIPPDEVAVRLNRLEKAGFANHRVHDYGHTRITAWFRTIAGDELVLAKRRAGEEEAAEHQTEHIELVQAEQVVMTVMAKMGAVDITVDDLTQHVNEAMPTIGSAYASVGMVAMLLVKLREKGLVVREKGRWTITPLGMVYLAERNLL